MKIRRREVPGAIELPKLPGMKPGDRVCVSGGPFAGHLGLYAGMTGRQRVEVLLMLLGGTGDAAAGQHRARTRQYGKPPPSLIVAGLPELPVRDQHERLACLHERHGLADAPDLVAQKQHLAGEP
jgi:hypothetical protein